MKEFAPASICEKCNRPMDRCEMEAIIAPPAKTLYLTKWSCSHTKKNDGK